PDGLATNWSQHAGPGPAHFEDAHAARTTATFAKAGDYELELAAGRDQLTAKSLLRVRVVAPPSLPRLDEVRTRKYRIDSPLWNKRACALIAHWIPHCIDRIEATDLREGQGGLDNFIEAAKALRGEPHGAHRGYVFANAWVHQTVEAM